MRKKHALIYTTRGGEDILFPIDSDRVLVQDVQLYGKTKKAGTRVDFDGAMCEVTHIQGGFILKCTNGRFHLYVGKVPYGTDYAPYAKVGTYASIEAASKSYIFAKVLTEGVVVNGPALKNAILALQKSRSGLRHGVVNLYTDAAVLTTSGVMYLDPYYLIELPEIGCRGMAVDLRDTDVTRWFPAGDVTMRFTAFGWKADDAVIRPRRQLLKLHDYGDYKMFNTREMDCGEFDLTPAQVRAIRRKAKMDKIIYPIIVLDGQSVKIDSLGMYISGYSSPIDLGYTASAGDKDNVLLLDASRLLDVASIHRKPITVRCCSRYVTVSVKGEAPLAYIQTLNQHIV